MNRNLHSQPGSRRQPGALRLSLLAAGAFLLGCKIVVVSGPTEVAVGDTVAYVLEISSASAFPPFYVAADVPAGWQLESATYVGTVGGAPVSGNGLVVQSDTCSSLFGALRPGFRRWYVQNPTLPAAVTAADSAEVTLEFTVESQPAGELKLYFLLAGIECSAPEVFTVNRPPGPRFLTLVQQLFDGAGVDGLGGPVAVTPSPDGQHLYVAGGVDESIAVFSRDETDGRLAFVEAESEGFADGLGPPAGLEPSPDGLYLYLPRVADSDTGNASGIALYARDPASGELTFVERIIENAENLAASPDGLHLYAAATAITVFSRDPSSGRLIFVDTAGNGGDLEMSPDGHHLYVANGSIRIFERDSVTGLLSFLGTASPGAAFLTVLSSDGRYLYGLSGSDVTVYLRDQATGLLSLVETVTELNGEPAADIARSLAMSPDGRYVAVAGPVDLTVFQRNPQTGHLTLVESQFSGDLPIDGFDGPGALAFSNGSRYLYAAGFDDDALLTFATAVVFSDGFESGTTSAWTAAVP